MSIDLDIPTSIGGLLLAFLFAWITAGMARRRNRETLPWAVFGFFFPCLAIVVLWIVGKAKKK